MQKNYKRLGDYIQPVVGRNNTLGDLPLVGLSIQKKFIPSIANTIGTDMSTYKIIEKNQFAYGPVTSRNGEKITIALFSDYEKALISQAYIPFEVKDTKELNPEYLMMWFCRHEFDRYARFKSHGSAREIFDWEEMCNVMLPIPSIEKQREIVEEYNTIQNRINLNQNLIQKLEATAQAIYKEWFVDGIDLEHLPDGWRIGTIGDYAKVKSGFAFKSEWWQLDGVPVIKIGSINNNTIDTNMLDHVSSNIIDKAKNYIVKKADIVIAMTGATIGKFGLIPELNSTILVNQRVGMFDLGNNPIEKVPFLYINLLNDSIQNEIINVGGDSAQANISNGQIESIEMIYPHKELIENFNRSCYPFFELILNKINENQKLMEMKDLLLSKLASVEK
ncbi:MAG: restriction endonuclease subunit [Bacteroidetes bacterium]|nr:restriction endonuclease subunit [Bacteroidota bacterium]